MRKLVVIMVALSLIALSIPALAAQGGRKGASERAFERASEEAIFHRVSDWFATKGKSEEEKKAIIAERQAKREAKRARKEAEKKRKIMQKEAEKQKKLTEKKIREIREKVKQDKIKLKKKLEKKGTVRE